MLFSLAVLVLAGCQKTAVPDAPTPKSLIPGECLKSTELSFVFNEDWGRDDDIVLAVNSHYGEITSGYYRFCFSMDMDLAHEVERGCIGKVTRQRYLPSEAVFNRFGGNAQKVKDAYEARWAVMNEPSITVFLREGLSLTANKDFAGFRAGENMAGALLADPKEPFIGAYASVSHDDIFPVSSIPDDCLNMLHTYGQAFFGFEMDIKGYRYTKEPITFTLSMPVKCAQYLTWLEQSITDENASMVWEDKTLTCTFTTKFRIVE